MSNGSNSITRARGPLAERPCEYMNCRRPKSEHRWAVDKKPGGRPAR
jgi:hypothetical protein